MGFTALPKKKSEDLKEALTEENNAANAVGWESLLAQPDDDDLEKGQHAGCHTDNKLQTNLDSGKLQTKLISINNDAQTYLGEKGVNILFLALGFLYWYESPSSQEPRCAPLLLIPVELKRSNAQERFKLGYTGEEIGDNLSLNEKLKAEFNIKLPQLEGAEELNVIEYMIFVAEAVKTDPRWRVEADEITLGFFSFGKFLMYKDLDLRAWDADTCGVGFAILNSLMTDGFKESKSIYDDETHIDKVVSPTEMHHVMDADSTQILAMLDVNTGRNLVLEGPPGTGKSQTITNIIAESIGNGKKALFVSEKMAALDVVKRRLDHVGLGDAVIELHSNKTNKKKVLDELDRTLCQGRPVAINSVGEIETLTNMRDQLNAYCDAINKHIGKTNTNFISALGNALKYYPGELNQQ